MSEQATAELVKRQLSASDSIEDAIGRVSNIGLEEVLVPAPGDDYRVRYFVNGLRALDAHGKGRDNIPTQFGLQAAAYELYDKQSEAAKSQN
jgi:hypothetical protein